jgi:hypothetical protein
MEDDWMFDFGAGCFYIVKRQAEVGVLDDDEADFIIEEFLGSLDSVESNLQMQLESRHDVHWWDG